MFAQSHAHFRCATLAVLAAVLLIQCSCDISAIPDIDLHQDPAKTVTVEITGISDGDDRDEIQETLKGMTDGSSHSMTSFSSGDTMTVKLSPVKDVKAFSRKINFGEVTEVDGRTVKVEFVK